MFGSLSFFFFSLSKQSNDYDPDSFGLDDLQPGKVGLVNCTPYLVTLYFESSWSAGVGPGPMSIVGAGQVEGSRTCTVSLYGVCTWTWTMDLDMWRCRQTRRAPAPG